MYWYRLHFANIISSKMSNKFDPLLTNVIDTTKVDLRLIRRQMRDYLREKEVTKIELVSDLIIDYLESECYPDAKVMLCDLKNIGLIRPEMAKKLIRKLWNDLLDSEIAHKDKYRRATSSNSTPKRVNSGTSSYGCQRPLNHAHQPGYSRYVDQPNRS